ncbi:unnamed protein product [Phytophthora lilii]|uniref:Unnamed protein product n=1 Tax=Phytophthora lilii TaxID=2077276 RepID=A0A9W6YFS4_9STRA|nr:unnamed protein product [Phytophthora lilii]
MFPSFRNKADREQKQQDLLARAERRSRQTTAKRVMYEEAIWASEADKVVTTKPTTATQSSETQTDSSVQTQLDPLKKSLLTQSDPTSVDQLPYEVDIQAIPSAPELPDLPPAFAPSAPPLPPHNELTLDHTLIATPNAAHDRVKEWFIAYPGLINLRINPVKLDGSVESRYVIGVKGSLYSARSGRIGRPRSIDWSATLERVMDIANEHIHSSVNDAIERIRNWYLTHPEWASLKVQPINRTGGQSSSYYIGARGELHDLRTGERTINLDYDSPEAIDWLATESHIRRMYSDGESNSIDELGEMRREDASAPPPPPPPRPAPSLSYDQAQELLEQIRDQDDSRAAMNEYMASHPDEEVTLSGAHLDQSL